MAMGVADPAPGQGTKADYRRADSRRGLVAGKVFRAEVTPHWSSDNTRFWYRNDLAGGAREFVIVDVAKGRRAPAFDHKKVAAALAKATGGRCDAARLPIDQLVLPEDRNAVRFYAVNSGWECDRSTSKLFKVPSMAKPKDLPPPPDRRRRRRAGSPQGAPGPHGASPRDKWTVLAKDGNLFLREKNGGKEHRLTTDGKPDDAYSAGVHWSPDGTRFVATRTAKAQEHWVYYVESSPKDQVQPKLHKRNYLKPGDRIASTKPHLFDVAAKKEIPVSDKLFPTPYQLGQVRWDADSKRFTFYYNQRGHEVARIIGVDAKTGKATPVIDEVTKTFFCYARKQFLHTIGDMEEIIWASERDGWNHLYLYNGKTGKVKNQITKGKWVVRKPERVDNAKRQIWFQAGGIIPGQDPYYVHYCRINFDGTGLVVMTAGDGTHEIAYSPDRKHIVDTYSRVDMAPVSELRRVADGKLVCELERADMTALLKTGWRAPERFVAKGRDGRTDIYGVIHRPTTFDASDRSKKYPVIEKIYAGPHGSFVPKSFRSYHSAQSMAELGFIVVQIDGMGTSNRSKAFHDVSWKNLGDSGFPDRVLWIKAAAKSHPYMDITRVGIYGGSAGGQSAMRALLSHGDFYKAAVSDCGCHDNRMDKIWWNEAWMGWPVGPHYAEASNVTHAHKLKGKLLLIVGEMDTNVDPASTMQVVNALVKADKDFDLIVVPGGGHGIGGAPYGRRRTRDFFVRHLLGVEPRSR